VFDPRNFHAGLFNGNKLPGGGPWRNSDHVPPRATPSLLAAFNGGFLFKDGAGGYVMEGKRVQPLRNGRATMAIGRDGVLHIGIYGLSIPAGGSWSSIRQNLPPMVVNGRSRVTSYPELYFGDDFNHEFATFRSALCDLGDGRYMYVVAGPIRAAPFGRLLASMGCQFAMQLDITGNWPQFAWYSGFGTTSRQGTLLDKRMSNPNRYLRNSQKDFIALFDPATLPDNTVR
jgi:hypothetical protein